MSTSFLFNGNLSQVWEGGGLNTGVKKQIKERKWGGGSIYQSKIGGEFKETYMNSKMNITILKLMPLFFAKFSATLLKESFCLY